MGLSAQSRAILGKAARFKGSKGWFKSVGLMEEAARDLIAPDFQDAIDPAIGQFLYGIFKWIAVVTADIDLLGITRGLVTAPAGCGKTQLIADALVRHSGPKPVLILTHTNAGVVALRARLDKARIKPSAYRLSTIDGWAIRLITTFPQRAGHNPSIVSGARPNYPAIREAAEFTQEPAHQ